MGLQAKENILILLQNEQYWINKLNTLTPNGLNKRKELPPQITFSLLYCVQAGIINKLVKQFYDKLQLEQFGKCFKSKFVSACKRNKTLKDVLVSAS